MIKRLIDFYNTSAGDIAESDMTCIWEGITRLYHKRLKDAIKSGSEARVKVILENFIADEGAHGMDHGGMVTPVGDVICTRFGSAPKHVLEIGGGLGFLGSSMLRLGSKSYTDIDLPTSAIAAAFHVSKTINPEKIWLCGEHESGNKYAHFHPSTNCFGVLNRKYDVIVTINCFPEIPIRAQDAYIQIASKCLSPDGILYSINHEGTVLQQRSLSIAMKDQKQFVCVRSNPAPIYSGYMEEIYKLAN